MRHDETAVYLVGIQAPKLPLGRPNFVAWPLAEEAKAALEGLTLGHRVALAYGGRRVDRHGRALAHLYLEEEAGQPPGVWVQGRLLELGLARVYSFADNRALVAEMLVLEGAARRARRGIWGLSYYAVRRPQEAAGDVGSFQVVEGIVVSASVVRGRAYLNFGADWRQDFTVSLAPPVRRRFEAEGIDPTAYQGQRLRVRGWLESWNGPMIEVTHPDQIEVLEE
jgi:endonuclease YncB( thermonuclease family)